MTERALDLMQLGENSLVLDIGCGSGLSGQILTEKGHQWIGVDISAAMLQVSKQRGAKGDLIHSDAGDGFRFLPGVFDGAISISVLQWLCNAETSDQVPFKRLTKLFESLYMVLARGSRAVFQFYPAHPQQIEMISHAAIKSGFTVDMIIDNPNSAKAKKYYLICYNGPVGYSQKPQAIQDEDTVPISKRGKRKGKKNQKPVKNRDWIINKKQRYANQGKNVKANSKYTGRKRKDRF